LSFSNRKNYLFANPKLLRYHQNAQEAQTNKSCDTLGANLVSLILKKAAKICAKSQKSTPHLTIYS